MRGCEHVPLIAHVCACARVRAVAEELGDSLGDNHHVVGENTEDGALEVNRVEERHVLGERSK